MFVLRTAQYALRSHTVSMRPRFQIIVRIIFRWIELVEVPATQLCLTSHRNPVGWGVSESHTGIRWAGNVSGSCFRVVLQLRVNRCTPSQPVNPNLSTCTRRVCARVARHVV